MNIVLYKNASDNNTIGKSLSGALTLSGALRDESSVISPSFRLTSAANIAQYNYAYIESFGRYYFIKGITVERTGVWSLDLDVDVLESFKAEILSLDATLLRQENEYNLYLNDPEWKVYTNKQVLTREFPSGFLDSGNYFLTVVGGYDDITEGAV